MKDVPAYVRDAIHAAVIPPAALWVWSAIVNLTELPVRAEHYVYPWDMPLDGPKQLNGKRVKVTFEIEPEATP